MNRTLASIGRAGPRGRQRGVVLFIALLVMVALSLAGIALIRSADTASIVAGNLAFKQAAAAAVDRSVEQANQLLFDPGTGSPVIADKTVDAPAQNYYACVQADGGGCLPLSTPIPEIPAMLITKTGITPVPVDLAGNTSYHVIERMCANAGAAVGSNCNLASAALGADAGTQHYEALNRVGSTYFRVSIRVDGPRKTVQYAQAILKE
jgi:hypothetical protein